MQEVSQAWKEAQLQNIVPMSYIEISYHITDPDAQADVSTSAETTSYGKPEQAGTSFDKNYDIYATLEHNHWILDGTRNIYEDVPEQDTGYVSPTICNRDALFESPTIFSMNFTRVHENLIAGVTITWSPTLDECARDFKVTAYNGTQAVATKTITDNTENITVVDIEIQNYNRIDIEVLEWCLPLKRARIEQILVGMEALFDKTDLIGYTHEQYADILTGDLPKNSIIFELDNVNQKYNPDNPQGLYKYLLQRQEIKVKYGYKLGNNIDWIQAGTFYTSEWKAPQNGITAEFTARDLLEFMTDKFTTTSTTITLYDLAIEALNLAKLPLNPDGSVKWVLDENLKNITITIPEDFDYTIAEVLQLVANAGRCVLYQDRQGMLHLTPISEVLTDYIINRFNSFENADYDITKELKAVDINDGMAMVSNSDKGETQTVSNALIQDATVATNVAEWIKETLKHRKLISGEYRTDPRLDALDKVTVINKYATNTAIITNVKYEYKGAFKGSYEGRVIDG